MSEKLVSLENLGQYHRSLMKGMVVTAKKDDVPYYWKVGDLDKIADTIKELNKKHPGFSIFCEIQCTDDFGDPNKYYTDIEWFSVHSGSDTDTKLGSDIEIIHKEVMDRLNSLLSKYNPNINIYIVNEKGTIYNIKGKVDYSPIYDEIIVLDSTFDGILNLHKKGTPIELHYSEIKSGKEDSIYQSTVMPLTHVDLSVKSGSGGITFKNNVGDYVVVYSDGKLESSLFKN